MILCMVTTLDLDPSLLEKVTKLHPGKTKKALVEMGLKELLNANERLELAKLFGTQKNIKVVKRKRI